MKMPKTVTTTFSTYIVNKPLGEGGSGIVFSAKDESGKDFAIKVLNPERATKEKLKRFKNEYLFCSRNQHPNIVTVTDYGLTEDKAPFFVMPLYSGSLRSLIGKITPQEALTVFGRILDGAEAAHKLGAIHRDLKPENILVNGSLGELVLADFGIADFEQDDLFTAVETKDGSRLANFQYASPEQRFRGKAVDKRADIYALGLILNELFTAELAHGTGYKLISSVLSDYSYLDVVVEKMLRQSPSERYSSIEEIKLDLLTRYSEYISLQKLNSLKSHVIPSNELDDPIVKDPMKITNVQWENGKLSIELNHVVNSDWVFALNNMGGYSSVLGKGPEMFSFDRNYARISSSESDAQRIIDFFKTWLPLANRRYENKLQDDIERRDSNLREELRKKVAAEELKMKINKSLRF